MHALVRNGVVEKYPYSLGNLRKDNPTTSFPKRPSDERLKDWDVYPVLRVPRPEVNPITHDVVERAPEFVGGSWTQVWEVVPAATEEVEKRKTAENKRIKDARAAEYKEYSDALFFKWQRGEGTQEEWLASVNHVRELFPYVD